MKTVTIPLASLLGNRADDLEIARQIRIMLLMPVFCLIEEYADADFEGVEEVELDFTGISYTTTAFIHELFREPLREYGTWIFGYITYKHPTRNVRATICKAFETILDKGN